MSGSRLIRRAATTCGSILATLAIATITGCDSHPPDPQLGWGWVTNCAGPAFSRFGGSGPGPDRPVFRVADQLVVAVPKSYRPYATPINRGPGECRKISDLPPANYLGFVFVGNWSAVYKREDVPPDLRPDRVVVRIDREFPSPLSAEDQRKIEQIGQEYHLRDLQGGAREIAGLTCIVPKIPYYAWFSCSGPRSGDSKLVKLRFTQENAHFVLILADYASSRYGGVHVFWKALTSDISHWRNIDDEMWRLLTDWNLPRNADLVPN